MENAMQTIQDIRELLIAARAARKGIEDLAKISLDAANSHEENETLAGFALGMCAAVSIIAAADMGSTDPIFDGLKALSSITK